MAGSKGARQPFFSPDGKWVAFFAQSQLQKAEVAGGSPGAPRRSRLSVRRHMDRGQHDRLRGVARLGTPADSCRRRERQSRSPGLTAPPMDTRTCGHKPSPGGRVLFTIWGQNKGNAVLSLDSGQWEMVLPTTTFASALFDARRLEGLRGGPGRLLLVDGSRGPPGRAVRCPAPGSHNGRRAGAGQRVLRHLN